MDRLFAEVPGEIIVDDFLIHGGNQHELDDKMIAVLKRSRKIGLKFNPHKAKLRVPKVSYVGHLFTADGLKPDPEKVKAFNEMPAPTDKDGILRFLGTVNYLDKFIEHKADLQGPISQLTRNDTAFVWETPQQQAFDKLKSVITSGPVLAYFDNTKETVLNVDASTDIFEYGGHSYLLVTDFYSKYFEIELLRQTTANCVINNLKKIFARFGIPKEVLSDNGSQYSNTRNLFNSSHEFKRLADEWGFRHTTSSPEYPQSNGAAEKAVQTAKRILKKAAADNKDPFDGLLKYRNTPFDDLGVSPAQLLMSRRTRTQLLTHRHLLLPRPVDPNQVVKTLKHRQSVSKKNYDSHSRDLPPLQVGDKVRIRPNRETGGKLKYCPDHTYWVMNVGVFLGEIGDKSFQRPMINR